MALIKIEIRDLVSSTCKVSSEMRISILSCTIFRYCHSIQRVEECVPIVKNPVGFKIKK